MNGLADQEDLRLRFDVLTKTKKPELHRYWTTRDRAANLRLFRLVSEVLRAIEAGVFHPVVGWHCQDCPYRSRCWAWGNGRLSGQRSGVSTAVGLQSEAANKDKRALVR
jgi:hypothetical protein